MKKKSEALLATLSILLLGMILWGNTPIDLLELDPNEVMEIVGV